MINPSLAHQGTLQTYELTKKKYLCVNTAIAFVKLSTTLPASD